MTTTQPTRQAQAIDRRSKLRQFLDDPKTHQQLADLATNWLPPERMIALARAMEKNDAKIKDIDPQSFLLALCKCMRMGLEPDGVHMSIIPYFDRRRGVSDCQAIPGYQGLCAIARRHGIESIRAGIVYEGDTFDCYEDETGTHFLHRPNWREERGKAILYYCTWWQDDRFLALVINRADVERARTHGIDDDEKKKIMRGAWGTDYDEMARKTAIRRASKSWPQTPDVKAAQEAIDEVSTERTQVVVHRPRFDSNFLASPSEPREDNKEGPESRATENPDPAVGQHEQQPAPPPPERPPDDEAKLAEAGLAPAQPKPRTRQQEYESNALVRDRVQGWMLNNNLSFEGIMTVAGWEGLVKNADSYGDLSQVPVASLRVIWDAKDGILAAVKAMVPKAEQAPKGMLI